MCARITLLTTPAEIADLFGLAYDDRTSHPPRYNVPPTEPIPVVRFSGGSRELAHFRWGLVPHWSAKPVGYGNARVETLADKPAFRDPFRSRRCIVPVDGFFEWETLGKKKLPSYFRRGGGGILALAGLWDSWQGPGGVLETVAIVTVPANELVRPLHDRMPAVLEAGQFGVWLNGRPDEALAVLRPYPAELMEAWPVSDRVNSVKAQGADLLLPVAARPRRGEPGLFDNVA